MRASWTWFRYKQMDRNNLTYLVRAVAGSHAYGLETPTSDKDIRGVFIHTQPKFILGTAKEESRVIKTENDDIVFHEMRKFYRLLQEGNSASVELLFSWDDLFLETSEAWFLVLKHRTQLLDSAALFSSLSGYSMHERSLAFGTTTRKLGKRKEQLAQYGFSPKNAVQMLRLAWAGAAFFRTGEFPVNMKGHNELLHADLMAIKTEPEKFTPEQLAERADIADAELKAAFESRSHNFVFNDDLANDLLLHAYAPHLHAAMGRLFI